MIRLLRKYLKPYRLQVIGVLVFVLLQVLCDLALPTITASIIDIGLMNSDMAFILTRGALMIMMSVLVVLSMIGVGYFSSRVSAGLSRDIRLAVFENAEQFSLNEMNSIGVSSLIVRTTNDVNTVRDFAVILMRMVLVAPIMLFGSLFLTLSVNARLARIVLVSVPLLLILFICLVVFATKYFTLFQKKQDQLNLLLREHLGGVRVIRAFVNQKTEQKKFEQGNNDLYRLALIIHHLASSMMPVMMLIINLTSVAVCWFGAKQIELGSLQVGQLVSFVQYVTMILMSLSMLSMLMVIAPRANVSARRLNEVLETEVQIRSPENPVTADEKDCDGTIEFDHVSFTYPGGDAPVLSDITFTAEGGKTTAIVGSTGSGKSTLLNLILRLYDVSEGSVRVDKVDVRDYDLENLRDKIGFVPQKGVLFTGTIADNVRFGCRHASDEELEHALRTSQAWDFVSEKENGVNEMISQGGKNVSGGQKQRLSIARAIIRKCEAYMFDDSFSALDFSTDARLRTALANDEYLGKTTRIIVAQRVSTVMNADKIIVLENGRLVGQGTHRELLATCPLYHEIASSQLSKEELE